MGKLVLGVATLVLSAGAASAQWMYPGYGYAAPGYAAPAAAGTTVIIVTPSPAYTAPPVASGYYNYAPGYWGGGHGWGGYGWRRAGYWWR